MYVKVKYYTKNFTQTVYRERAPELHLDPVGGTGCLDLHGTWPKHILVANKPRLPSLGSQKRWRGTFRVLASNLLSEILELEDEKCLGAPVCILVQKVNKHSEIESKPISNGRFVKAEEGDTLSQAIKFLSIGIVES